VTLAWGGYYTAVMDAGVHVVALQTNFYDDANLFLKWGVGHWDMSGQLHWMESVLEQIQDLGEKAVILCHQKPRSFTRGVWAIKFQEILEKYSANIIAILAGHDHNDMTHVVHSRKSFMSTFRGDNEIVESILEQPWLKAKEKEVAMERAVHDGDIRTAEPILVEYLSSSVTPMARRYVSMFSPIFMCAMIFSGTFASHSPTLLSNSQYQSVLPRVHGGWPFLSH